MTAIDMFVCVMCVLAFILLVIEKENGKEHNKFIHFKKSDCSTVNDVKKAFFVWYIDNYRNYMMYPVRMRKKFTRMLADALGCETITELKHYYYDDNGKRFCTYGLKLKSDAIGSDTDE